MLTRSKKPGRRPCRSRPRRTGKAPAAPGAAHWRPHERAPVALPSVHLLRPTGGCYEFHLTFRRARRRREPGGSCPTLRPWVGFEATPIFRRAVRLVIACVHHKAGDDDPRAGDACDEEAHRREHRGHHRDTDPSEPHWQHSTAQGDQQPGQHDRRDARREQDERVRVERVECRSGREVEVPGVVREREMDRGGAEESSGREHPGAEGEVRQRSSRPKRDPDALSQPRRECQRWDRGQSEHERAMMPSARLGDCGAPQSRSDARME